jgi:coenzyme F420-reducing hydrogenase delta subunit
MSSYEPKVVCFSCKFGWGYLSDENDLAGQIKNWVPIVCSGKVDSSHILNAFKQDPFGTGEVLMKNFTVKEGKRNCRIF